MAKSSLVNVVAWDSFFAEEVCHSANKFCAVSPSVPFLGPSSSSACSCNRANRRSVSNTMSSDSVMVPESTWDVRPLARLIKSYCCCFAPLWTSCCPSLYSSTLDRDANDWEKLFRMNMRRSFGSCMSSSSSSPSASSSPIMSWFGCWWFAKRLSPELVVRPRCDCGGPAAGALTRADP